MILPGGLVPIPHIAESGPPAIGEAWQGGYYIGDISDGGTTYHLVLAPKASGQTSGLTWKTSNTSTAGTTSTTNGLANSNAMNNASHPAAQFCRGLSIAGFTDWYMPAKDELNVIYTNRASVGGADAIDADTTAYWSSTESASTSAWLQSFNTGTQSTTIKTNISNRVRAIRRIAA